MHGHLAFENFRPEYKIYEGNDSNTSRYICHVRICNLHLKFGWNNLPNPSNRIMAIGSTQPLTEMSTRNVSGGAK
jgi:hypothetical protein